MHTPTLSYILSANFIWDKKKKKNKKKNTDLPQENVKDTTDVIRKPKLKKYRQYTMAKWLTPRGVTLERKPVVSHEWQKDGIVIKNDKRNISAVICDKNIP